MNTLVLIVCGYAVYWFVREVIDETSRFNLWHLLYLLPIMAFAGCAVYFAWGLKRPTHSHLSLLVTTGFFAAITAVPYWASQFAYHVFISEIAASINRVLFWFFFIIVLAVAITADWRIGKAAGFIKPEEKWWVETNIRGFCVFLGWWLFFGGMSWLPEIGDTRNLYTDQLGTNAAFLIFLAFIAFCFFIGKLLPRLAMSLTGVEPAPRVPRRRRKGFHLYQSTEPIPTSAPTED